MKRDYWIFIVFIALCLLYVFIYPKTGNRGVPNQDHVILISVDGLRSDAIDELGEEGLPHIYYLMKNGASTLNARTDYYSTETIPNHAAMFTALPSDGVNGHMVKTDDIGEGLLNDYAGREVTTIFDVVHNAGLRTAFFAAKPDFDFFIQSFGDSLDSYRITKYQDREAFGSFLDELFKNRPNLVFLHFSAPERTGQKKSWRVSPNSDYLTAVKSVDRLLGVLLEKLARDEVLDTLTVIILTSDHGGFRRTHDYAKNPHNYTIPFIVWGDGVSPGTDLYQINNGNRADPGNYQKDYFIRPQPVRNADAANLAMFLLDLPPIKGSIINADRPLRVAVPVIAPQDTPAEKID